jgi:hypothetical protein
MLSPQNSGIGVGAWLRLMSLFSENLFRLDQPGAYAFAIFCVAVATAVRWALGIWFEGSFCDLFPGGFAGSPVVGGIGPGIFAALIGGFIGWWAFLAPLMAFFPLTPGAIISLLAYLTTSLIIVWAADHYRGLTKRLEGEEKFRELAVEELAHRLKNKVATIQSIVSLRLREDPQARDEICKMSWLTPSNRRSYYCCAGSRRSRWRYTVH